MIDWLSQPIDADFVLIVVLAGAVVLLLSMRDSR